MAILQDQTTAMAQELARLRAENEALKAKAARSGPFRCKVSEKGALSVYGLGRFPVTLYKGQWTRLFGHKDEIEEFMLDHDEMLKGKDD